MVRLLLDSGVDINSISGYFETALLATLEGDHLAIVELLVSRGINVNHSSLEHGTALHYACLHRIMATILKLLEYGADVNVSGGPHVTPLAAAACRKVRSLGSTEESHAVVELLRWYQQRYGAPGKE